MSSSNIKCSGCEMDICVPIQLANKSSIDDAVYNFLRKNGWEFTSRFLWVCPDCLDASTSPATQALPGRLHERDWQPKT